MNNLQAQLVQVDTAYFTEIDSSSLNLSVGETRKLNRARDRYGAQYVKIVRIGKLSQVQDSGALKLNLPGVDCDPSFICRDIQYESDADYEWAGSVFNRKDSVAWSAQTTDTLCWEGEVDLICKNGKVFGSISLSYDQFEIYSLRTDTSILISVPRSPTNGINCGNVEPPKSLIVNNEPKKGSGYAKTLSTCPVTILALVTKSASDEMPDVGEYIETAIRQVNHGLINSDISTSQARVELLDIVPLQPSVFTPTGIMRDDVVGLTTNSTITALRDQYDADIVIVYTGDDYNGPFGRVADFLSNPDAYAIVETTQSLGQYVTPHEVGHIFGAQHQRCDRCNFLNEPLCGESRGICNDDGTAHAHFFRTAWWPISNRKHTIVDAGELNEKRQILFYSNPTVKFNSEPTGTSNSNNSEVIAESACVVASFRTETAPPVNVSIDAPSVVCECVSATATANVIGGVPGTIDYDWEVSYDGGITYTALSSTFSNISFDMNCGTSATGVTLRVTATDQSNSSATATKFVQSTLIEENSTIYCDFEKPAVNEDRHVRPGNVTIDRENETDRRGGLENLRVFPNPASQEITVSFDDNSIARTIMISGIEGRKLISQEIPKGVHSVIIDVSRLKAGFYTIHSESEESITNRQILIVKQ